jgi:tRNA (cmo5U34)-methyltransferase
MLDAAALRVAAETSGSVRTVHGDIRTVDLPEGGYDVLLAAAVLHHLRDEADWESVFAKLYRLLRPGGSLWITDLVAHDHPAVQGLMWQRYGDYLAEHGGPAYRDEVFAYIDQEDSPRSTGYQLDLLRRVGFTHADILHKNGCFAAFGAVKAS